VSVSFCVSVGARVRGWDRGPGNEGEEAASSHDQRNVDHVGERERARASQTIKERQEDLLEGKKTRS
jgi:hypothetical protein